MERTGVTAFQGEGLTLVGDEVKLGQQGPDFEVLDNSLAPKKLSDYKGSICIISAVPSLDTPVCDLQTKRFNEEAAKLGDNIKILTISMDLPFAQARWCGASGVSNLQTLSDHKDASFGNSFGVLIKELRLLARSIFIVDAGGIIRYIQIVSEVTQEPDYAAVLDALQALK